MSDNEGAAARKHPEGDTTPMMSGLKSLLETSSEGESNEPKAKRRRKLEPEGTKPGGLPIKLFSTRRRDGSSYSSTSSSSSSSSSSSLLLLNRQHCQSLREMLGFGCQSSSSSIGFVVVYNYLIDFDFFLEEIPELLSCPKTIVFYGYGSTPLAWKQCVAGVVEFHCLRPSDPPQSPTNPLPFRTPYGVHHTKMFLVGYTDGTLRVVIHTANLRKNDIHLKTQGAYVQDFPLKKNNNNNNNTATCAFEDDLVEYLETYRYNKKQQWIGNDSGGERSLCQELRRYDFSAARVVLLPSTPGRHKFDGRRGYLKLSKAIRDNTPQPQTTTTTTTTTITRIQPIVCQFSSMGSLTVNWLKDFVSALDVNRQDCNALSTNRIRLVYPTVEEIRTSVEGYAGGQSVPGSSKNVGKAFLQPLYHRWSGEGGFERSRHVPHIKTYYQLSPDHQSMEWFVLTSHNMSRAAWGEKQMSSYGARQLFIRHWELGVFVSPNTVGPTSATRLMPATLSSTTGKDPDAVLIPIPYPLSPEPYRRHQDHPWAVDKSYDQVDDYGRTSASGI